MFDCWTTFSKHLRGSVGKWRFVSAAHCNTIDCEVDAMVLQAVARSPSSSDAQCSQRDPRGDEIPSEIQYVGVLIKSVFSDCELLKHAYLELACLIGCVCVRALVYAFSVRG